MLASFDTITCCGPRSLTPLHEVGHLREVLCRIIIVKLILPIYVTETLFRDGEDGYSSDGTGLLDN